MPRRGLKSKCLKYRKLSLDDVLRNTIIIICIIFSVINAICITHIPQSTVQSESNIAIMVLWSLLWSGSPPPAELAAALTPP